MTKEEIWADHENIFGTDLRTDDIQDILDGEHQRAVPGWMGPECVKRNEKRKKEAEATVRTLADA